MNSISRTGGLYQANPRCAAPGGEPLMKQTMYEAGRLTDSLREGQFRSFFSRTALFVTASIEGNSLGLENWTVRFTQGPLWVMRDGWLPGRKSITADLTGISSLKTIQRARKPLPPEEFCHAVAETRSGSPEDLLRCGDRFPTERVFNVNRQFLPDLRKTLIAVALANSLQALLGAKRKVVCDLSQSRILVEIKRDLSLLLAIEGNEPARHGVSLRLIEQGARSNKPGRRAGIPKGLEIFGSVNCSADFPPAETLPVDTFLTNLPGAVDQLMSERRTRTALSCEGREWDDSEPIL